MRRRIAKRGVNRRKQSIRHAATDGVFRADHAPFAECLSDAIGRQTTLPAGDDVGHEEFVHALNLGLQVLVARIPERLQTVGLDLVPAGVNERRPDAGLFERLGLVNMEVEAPDRTDFGRWRQNDFVGLTCGPKARGCREAIDDRDDRFADLLDQQQS